MRRRGRALGLVLALCVALAGGGVGTSSATRVAVVQAAPLAQAAPGPFVQQAFDLLMDRFVTPPSSQTLLAGGWEGGTRFVQERASAAPSGDAPSLTGDRGQDWQAFLGAYPNLVSALAGAAEPVDLDRAVVRGMAGSLPSGGAFLRPPDAGPLSAQSAYGGIGTRTSRDNVVLEAYAGGPAEAAGVKFGDRVLAVDGLTTEGQASTQVAERVRGEVGTTVSLTLQRPGVAEPFDVTVTRAQIVVPWVTSRVLDGGVGYLRLGSFPQEQPDLFESAVATVSGASALVVDLRGSGGGFWTTVRAVAGRFVPEGPVFEAVNRQGQVNVQGTMGAPWGRDIPIVGLIDEGSRFESETLASVLRDRGSAVIVGVKTSVNAGGSTLFPLAEGSGLLVRTTLVRSSKGEMISGVGVEPDIVVELDPAMLAEGKDSQLEAALAHLRGKLGQ